MWVGLWVDLTLTYLPEGNPFWTKLLDSEAVLDSEADIQYPILTIFQWNMVPYSTLLDSEATVGILLISAGLGGDSWNMVNIGYCDPHIVFHLEYER